MSPFEHGEVFVLDDGGEVDLDLGNYERFLDIKLTHENNITTGKIYQFVIDKERRGRLLGRTVQVANLLAYSTLNLLTSCSHITDAIQEWIERVAMLPVDGKEGPADVCVIELGGTIGNTVLLWHNENGILDAGDIESMPFIEALGQFSCRVGAGNFCLVHVSLVPVLNAIEQKTKPTQHSVRGLRGLGLTPNVLACRCASDQKAHDAILRELKLQGVGQEPMLEEWSSMADICNSLREPVRIAIVGKYTGLSDSYLSVLKALLHASLPAVEN
ncbi:hypothetical protein HPP92_024147 [Vanilla planifolia]|uniref:CTP synthase N-terminal domain-containing protein n=1 Tax=Vanilla planifolia TaxID=51239 RepID=A0A835UB99_VANPL|nr:hypothetical protein HPP92_024147 [Vanilla planifolia]